MNARTGQLESRTRDDALASVRRALNDVMDPEIPTISVIDLGMIADVRVADDNVIVDMTPTFAGCPAIELIKREIVEACDAAGVPGVTVNVVYDPPWTTDRITEQGRRKLHDFGLAPPGPRPREGEELIQLQIIKCPLCGSLETQMESLFGPTLCRSIHYCKACRQSFEHFKPVG